MSNLQELRDRLRKGFYVDNLYEMAYLCKALALETPAPVPFFLMQRIFWDIARDWEERPVPVEEAKESESRMTKPIEDLIDAIEVGASPSEVLYLRNCVVSAFWGSSL